MGVAGEEGRRGNSNQRKIGSKSAMKNMLVRQAGRMEVEIEADRSGCGADWHRGFETRPMNVTFCFPQH